MSVYQETKIHGTPGFPYIVYLGILPEHINGIPHHWHEEMEIIYVTDGMISVSVGNNEYALSCGFPNLSYFSRAFLEKFGLSPSDYRKIPVPGTKSIDKEVAVG